MCVVATVSFRKSLRHRHNALSLIDKSTCNCNKTVCRCVSVWQNIYFIFSLCLLFKFYIFKRCTINAMASNDMMIVLHTCCRQIAIAEQPWKVIKCSIRYSGVALIFGEHFREAVATIKQSSHNGLSRIKHILFGFELPFFIDFFAEYNFYSFFFISLAIFFFTVYSLCYFPCIRIEIKLKL